MKAPRLLSALPVLLLLLAAAAVPAAPVGWKAETRIGSPTDDGETWSLPEDGRGAALSGTQRAARRLARFARARPAPIENPSDLVEPIDNRTPPYHLKRPLPRSEGEDLTPH